jgi:hypothetical protein
VLLVNALLLILFLSDTYGGRVYDKRIADATLYPLPVRSRLLQDLGFLAFTLPQVEILRRTKKPRGEEQPSREPCTAFVRTKGARYARLGNTMKPYTWRPEKDAELQSRGRPSFAQIVAAIQAGGLRDTLPTHRPDVYGGQQRFIVEWDGDIYVVPFRETATEMHLITVHADRRLRTRYLRKES